MPVVLNVDFAKASMERFVLERAAEIAAILRVNSALDSSLWHFYLRTSQYTLAKKLEKIGPDDIDPRHYHTEEQSNARAYRRLAMAGEYLRISGFWLRAYSEGKDLPILRMDESSRTFGFALTSDDSLPERVKEVVSRSIRVYNRILLRDRSLKYGPVAQPMAPRMTHWEPLDRIVPGL